MKIVADESVDRQIVDRLRMDGHDVMSIAELDPGIDDETVLGHSLRTNAILMTADKDFGELVFRQHLIHSGVLLIRLAGLKPELKAEGDSRLPRSGARLIGRASASGAGSPISL